MCGNSPKVNRMRLSCIATNKIKQNRSKIRPTICHSPCSSSSLAWLSIFSVILESSFMIPLLPSIFPVLHTAPPALLASFLSPSFSWSLVASASSTRTLPQTQERHRVTAFNQPGTGVSGTRWYMFRMTISTIMDVADTQIVAVRYTAVKKIGDRAWINYYIRSSMSGVNNPTLTSTVWKTY